MLLNSAVKLLRLYSEVIDELKSMEHSRNDIDRGILNYWEQNQIQCHSVHQKSYMVWHVTEPKPLQ
jgi:hypothetical protein